MPMAKHVLPRRIRRTYSAPRDVMVAATADFPDYDVAALQRDLRVQIELATSARPEVLTHWLHRPFLSGSPAVAWLDAETGSGSWWSRPVVWRGQSRPTVAAPFDPDGGMLMLATWGPQAAHLHGALSATIERYEQAEP
ncbi:MAG TPA: hypothetical protein VMZ11_03825 [Mycobacteriales bacterium]|nr:hypothetical protein [Mycobacteriales bacterium]